MGRSKVIEIKPVAGTSAAPPVGVLERIRRAARVVACAVLEVRAAPPIKATERISRASAGTKPRPRRGLDDLGSSMAVNRSFPLYYSGLYHDTLMIDLPERQ